MVRFYIGIAGLVLACLPLAIGCGGGGRSGEVEVGGTITIEGEPIERGSITFLPSDNSGTVGGGVIRDGQYTATVAPGDKIVMVIGSKKVGERLRLEGVPDSGTEEEFETVTHANYNAQHLTPLRANIEGPTEGLDFELTKDGTGG